VPKSPTPRYDSNELPAEAKYPFGPYRQAPAEFGGQWWLVNPFTAPHGIMPWVLEAGGGNVPKDRLPDGFEAIFGPRPLSQDFHKAGGVSAFQAATGLWEQNLAQFKQAGYPLNNLPEPYTAEEFKLAADVFVAWEMGSPRFYEGRYGWVVRFPASRLPDYQSGAFGAIKYSHLVIAEYQVQLLQRGVVPTKHHPFVPPQLFPGGVEIDPNHPTSASGPPLPDPPKPHIQKAARKAPPK
jgi:hypothetical protein